MYKRQVKKYRPNIGAPRTAPNEEPAAERACDFRPVDTGFTKEDAIAEANRCLDCKKPLCMQGCPVGVNIPGFIAKIREEDWGGALETIKGDNLLPSDVYKRQGLSCAPSVELSTHPPGVMNTRSSSLKSMTTSVSDSVSNTIWRATLRSGVPKGLRRCV